MRCAFLPYVLIRSTEQAACRRTPKKKQSESPETMRKGKAVEALSLNDETPNLNG